MRPDGKIKLGFFPLPVSEAERLRSCLKSSAKFSALDPCVGDGRAFARLVKGNEAYRYGVEIDANRAEQAMNLGIDTLQADTTDVRCPAETFSLLYLNPPYDLEVGRTNNQRLELVFLEHTYRWLKCGGVLVFVIPQPQLKMCARLLGEHFTDLTVYKLTEPESLQYRQVAILGSAPKPAPALAGLRAARWCALAGDVVIESGFAGSERPTGNLLGSAFWTGRTHEYRNSAGRTRRPAARFGSLPPGKPSAPPQAPRGPRPAAHAFAWWPCGSPLYRRNTQRNLRRRRRSSHRALAIGQIHGPLGRRARRWYENPA